jgi:hypothetical protein
VVKEVAGLRYDREKKQIMKYLRDFKYRNKEEEMQHKDNSSIMEIDDYE